MQAAIITVGWKAEREVANATAAVSWEVAQAERQNHVGPNKERKKNAALEQQIQYFPTYEN